MNTTACKRLFSLGCVAHTDGAVFQGIPAQMIADTPSTKYQIEHLGCGCGVAALYANQTHYKRWQASIQALSKLPNIQGEHDRL